MPAVSAAEVAELKAEGEALSLDDVDNTLQTTAEIIGYLIHQLRSIGADQAEVLHDVELVVRAAGMWREDVRQSRDILLRLGYGRDLAMLLTKLARRAKPRPQLSHRTASAEHAIARKRAEREKAEAAAAAAAKAMP
jgi:hypothetical protein